MTEKTATAVAVESTKAVMPNESMIKEIEAIANGFKLGHGKYTRLFKRVINQGVRTNDADLLNKFIEAVRTARYLPLGKTIALMQDKCGITVRKDGSSYACTIGVMSPDELKEMNEFIGDKGFLVVNYSPKKAEAKEEEDFADKWSPARKSLEKKAKALKTKIDGLLALTFKTDEAKARNTARIGKIQDAVDAINATIAWIDSQQKAGCLNA